MSNIKHGLEVLQNNVRIAPEKPGVYRMISAQEEVLYVGKAKNIKKRIVWYTKFEKLPTRLKRMVAEVDRMEFILVETEAQALILENELIKRFSPRFNILLKDDKSFPYLMFNPSEDFPALRKYRGKKNNAYRYFGPFANVTALKEVTDILQKVFKLRSCRESVFSNRQRPCLLYQIKRCSGPCVQKISKEEYHQTLQDVVDFLEGKNARIQEDLSKKMLQASESRNYEQAILFRDRIKALTGIQSEHQIAYADLKSTDIIALARVGKIVCIELFVVRGGQNFGNVSYFPKQAQEASDTEILEAFISDFYSTHPVPKEILISEELENRSFLEEALNVKIITCQKGNKYALIQRAKENAVAAIERNMALEASSLQNLKEMAKVFGLKKIPQRIEIYDNSHNQGSYAVGAMVVATKNGFDKKAYRTFNIKETSNTNDDFAMMQEVLKRRFAHLNPENKPDVILLDGGLGQLHAVYDALQEADLTDIEIIAISKGPERNAGKEFYHRLNQESIALEYRSPLAFYMQNLRDEAHRFAIGTHRKKRAKSVYKSRLDEIEGIGSIRKKDLLNYFGSAEDVATAKISDLQKVNGISKKTAEKIFNYFHN